MAETVKTFKAGATLADLTTGDRICWHAGAACSAWGTVTGVKELHYVEGVNGPVFHGITVTVDVPHFPTFDKWGWPVSEPRHVTRRFDRWGSDIEWAYTPQS
jgi:hypothetical protein